MSHPSAVFSWYLMAGPAHDLTPKINAMVDGAGLQDGEQEGCCERGLPMTCSTKCANREMLS